MALVCKSNTITDYSDENAVSITAVPKPQHSFGLRIVTVLTEQNKKMKLLEEIHQTIGKWREAIKARATVSQLKAASSSNFSFKEIALEDKEAADSYNSLIANVELDVKILKSGQGGHLRSLLVLHDSTKRIQAIASVNERTQSVYVDTLMSAAWNVPMQGSNTEEHQAYVVKGAGTTLMRQVYELARARGKARVELTPLDSAIGFYDDHLKMKRLFSSLIRYFDVVADFVPKTLQVPAGNLLANSV
jgi:hypothetical protein